MFVDVKDLPKFKVTDKVKLHLKYRNRWVDYCPEDGVGPGIEYALCSFVTFTHKGYYYQVIKPKFNEESDSYSEEWKDEFNTFEVIRFKINQLHIFANEFNSLAIIYKVSQLAFNDEALFNIAQGQIYSKRTDTDKQANREFRKFMKTLN